MSKAIENLSPQDRALIQQILGVANEVADVQAARDEAIGARDAAITARDVTNGAQELALAAANSFPSLAEGEAATPVGGKFSYLDNNNRVVLARRTPTGSVSLDEYFNAKRLNFGNDDAYQAPVTFAAGISVTNPLQTVTYNGALYTPRQSALPFTTTSVFSPAQWIARNHGYQRFWTPEMFGAANEINLNDETAAIKAAFKACRDTGYPLVLNRLYCTSGLELLDADASGVVVIGNSSRVFKTPTKYSKRGFVAYQDNQDYIVKLGDGPSNNKVHGMAWHGVLIHGRDFHVNKAALLLGRFDESDFHLHSTRRVKGPAIMMERCADLHFWGLNNGFCGADDGRPIVMFSKSYPDGQGNMLAGNNVIRFIGGRSEFCDGPFFGSDPSTTPDPTTKKYPCWVETVEITDHKFESGNYGYNNEPELGVATTSYGSSMDPALGTGYPYMDFRHCDPTRLSLDAHDIHTARAHATSAMVRVGDGARFRMHRWTVNLDADKTVKLFEIRRPDGAQPTCRGFEFLDGMYRTYGGTNIVQPGNRVIIDNNNRLPIKYRLPRFPDINGSIDSFNDRPQFHYASEHSAYPPDANTYGAGAYPYLVPEPAPATDPAFSPGRTVLKLTGVGTQVRLFTIGNNDYANTPIGINKRNARGRDLLIRIRTYTLAAGTGGTIRARNDVGTQLASMTLTTTNPDKWVDSFIRIPNKVMTDKMYVTFDGAGDGSYVAYLDSWEYEWDDWAIPRVYNLGYNTGGAAFTYTHSIQGLAANNVATYRLIIDFRSGATKIATYTGHVAVFTSNDGAASFQVDLTNVIYNAAEWTTPPAVAIKAGTDDGQGNATLEFTGDPVGTAAYGSVKLIREGKAK